MTQKGNNLATLCTLLTGEYRFLLCEKKLERGLPGDKACKRMGERGSSAGHDLRLGPVSHLYDWGGGAGRGGTKESKG